MLQDSSIMENHSPLLVLEDKFEVSAPSTLSSTNKIPAKPLSTSRLSRVNLFFWFRGSGVGKPFANDIGDGPGTGHDQCGDLYRGILVHFQCDEQHAHKVGYRCPEFP